MVRIPALLALSAFCALSTNATAQCEIDQIVPSSGLGWMGFTSVTGDIAVVSGGGAQAAVFERLVDGWTEVDSFQSPGFFLFQYIALDSSGGTAVTGAQEANADMSGAAYVFERNQGWAMTQTLIPSNAEAYDALGAGVAIEGDTIVLGATMSVYDIGACGPGKGWVFERDGTGTWVQTAAFWPHGYSNTMIMYGVAVDTDSQTAVIGASDDDETGFFAGAAYVYERDATGWHEAVKLLAPNPTIFGEFGTAVEVEGDVLFVGDDTDGGMGAVHVYERGATGWESVQVLAPADLQPSDRFGCAISMSGNRVAIGATGADEVITNGGAVYIFERGPAGWVQTIKLVADDAAEGAAYGSSLALDDNVLMWQGVGDIRVHSFGANGESYCLSVINSSGAAAVITTEGCGSLQGNTLTMRVDDAPASQPGVFFFAVDPAQVPFFDGFLCLSPPHYRLSPSISSPMGVLRTPLDFGTWPASLVTAGTTWRFQAFLRDPGFGMGVNTSDAIEIVMLP